MAKFVVKDRKARNIGCQASTALRYCPLLPITAIVLLLDILPEGMEVCPLERVSDLSEACPVVDAVLGTL